MGLIRMNFVQKYLNETIRAIEYITRSNLDTIIDVKKIRAFYDIDTADKSKINFYWRSLQFLEERGILELIGNRTPRQYRVLNYFELFQMVYTIYQGEVGIQQI